MLIVKGEMLFHLLIAPCPFWGLGSNQTENSVNRIIREIPPGTFAPNIFISAILTREHARVFNLPVPNTGRNTGTPTLVKGRLWKAAALSFLQLARFRLKTP